MKTPDPRGYSTCSNIRPVMGRVFLFHNVTQITHWSFDESLRTKAKRDQKLKQECGMTEDEVKQWLKSQGLLIE